MRQHALAVVEESDARLRLLRTVSHEVRNVLNAVSIAAQSLPEETDDAMREETTAIVLRNVRHMRELLDQLLEVSALIAERKASPASRFSPAALVQEIAATYGPMAAGKETDPAEHGRSGAGFYRKRRAQGAPDRLQSGLECAEIYG